MNDQREDAGAKGLPRHLPAGAGAERDSVGEALGLLIRFANDRDLRVDARPLPPDTPMRFDGVSITLRDGHDQTELLYYLAHSVGSIAGWSLDYAGVKSMFDE